jgi:hypothetical protein
MSLLFGLIFGFCVRIEMFMTKIFNATHNTARGVSDDDDDDDNRRKNDVSKSAEHKKKVTLTS